MTGLASFNFHFVHLIGVMICLLQDLFLNLYLQSKVHSKLYLSPVVMAREVGSNYFPPNSIVIYCADLTSHSHKNLSCLESGVDYS